MDCGFKLIRIFQQELWWIFILNTDVWAEQTLHGIELYIQHNTLTMRMNIDPCTSKVKVTWLERQTQSSVRPCTPAHYFLIFSTIQSLPVHVIFRLLTCHVQREVRGIGSMQSVGISSSHLQIKFRVLWVLGTLAEWEGKGPAIRMTMLIWTLGVHITPAAKKMHGAKQFRLS